MARSKRQSRRPAARREPDTPPATATGWPFLLALALLAVAAYANGLTTPFVLDDQTTVVDNSTIRDFSTALRPPDQFATAGRPLVNLSLAVNYAIGGANPFGYHLFNLATHVLCAFALFGIVRRTFVRLQASLNSEPWSPEPEWIAFAVALVWMIHPLQTEVVEYVTQRTESMMALCYLLTLYCAIRGFGSTEQTRWFMLAVAACASGMACKESMVTAPVMVLAYDSIFVAGGPRAALVRRRWLYAGLAATWIPLALLNLSGPRLHSAGFTTGISPWTYLLNQSVLICRYLRLTFWPVGLVANYGVPRALRLGDVIPYAAAIIVLLGAASLLIARRPRLGFAALWTIVTLAPTSTFVPIATEVGAERRMYLPLAGLVALAVVAAARLARSRPARQMAIASLVVVCAALVTLTVRRNHEYRAGAEEFWRTVLARYPQARAHYNLGVVLQNQGRRDEAIREYRIAATEFPDARYALGFDAETQGRHREAVAELREYVRLKPDDINAVRAYNLIGRALSADRQYDEALAAFDQVLRMERANADAQFGRALSLAYLRRFDDAARAYEVVIARNPADVAARLGLADALMNLNRPAEALPHLQAAVQLRPSDPVLRGALADLEGQLAAAQR